MIFGPGSKEKLSQWQKTYDLFKDKIVPNRKSGSEVVEYLKSKYILNTNSEDKYLKPITESVLNNTFLRQRLSSDLLPQPVAFIVENKCNGEQLYKNQEPFWQGCPVYVGIDLTTGYVQVEGSCYLYDELYAFQGVDEYDLENCVRIAEYIDAIKIFNKDFYNSLL